MPPKPFTAHIPDAVLTDLRDRLARTRWPAAMSDDGDWRRGTDLVYLRGLVDYWRDSYDWRAQEAALNAFRQFTVTLDGTRLHFIHEPGVGPHPMPLLLAHGWPGSVWEFHTIIPMLTDPARFGGDAADAFTVVAPSLPGYGFSYRPDDAAYSYARTARIFAALMTDTLGYERFAAQGGDVGAIALARLSADSPERLHGLHLNQLPARPDITPLAMPTEEEANEGGGAWGGGTPGLGDGFGYIAIQADKPCTLAYGLTDSPVGLAAWIVEKFRAWSDCGGDVERVFTRDDLLTNVMLYWATGAVGSSFWPYFTDEYPVLPGYVAVPTAYAAFPKEFPVPLPVAERVFNIQRWTEMPAGGHFAALEQPEALAADVRAFFRPFRAAGRTTGEE